MAVCFLWHFPASHLGLPLAITLLCEVRTFLDSVPELLNQHKSATSRGRPANSSATATVPGAQSVANSVFIVDSVTKQRREVADAV